MNQQLLAGIVILPACFILFPARLLMPPEAAKALRAVAADYNRPQFAGTPLNVKKLSADVMLVSVRQPSGTGAGAPLQTHFSPSGEFLGL